MKRFVVIVLDGFGMNAMADAATARPGDEIATTFGSILADFPDLKLPTLEAFLGVAGAINDRDYINGGRTLENLGFPEGMTMEEIYAQI